MQCNAMQCASSLLCRWRLIAYLHTAACSHTTLFLVGYFDHERDTGQDKHVESMGFSLSQPETEGSTIISPAKNGSY